MTSRFSDNSLNLFEKIATFGAPVWAVLILGHFLLKKVILKVYFNNKDLDPMKEVSSRTAQKSSAQGRPKSICGTQEETEDTQRAASSLVQHISSKKESINIVESSVDQKSGHDKSAQTAAQAVATDLTASSTVQKTSEDKSTVLKSAAGVRSARTATQAAPADRSDRTASQATPADLSARTASQAAPADKSARTAK
ncbi:hypothetical protein QR680_016627 [Steinernema hermaphroditum]|uniref:Uncharacterized protein n=1 Tax=Steinernema hermaphroditum TaxID=289476 RepID=A0AA39HDR7_9BILA|nr:hypothetical protein QR680_016627 [Steinernema hermaphroditum]